MFANWPVVVAQEVAAVVKVAALPVLDESAPVLTDHSVGRPLPMLSKFCVYDVPVKVKAAFAKLTLQSKQSVTATFLISLAQNNPFIFLPLVAFSC
jgi:hypothetical protein